MTLNFPHDMAQDYARQSPADLAQDIRTLEVLRQSGTSLATAVDRHGEPVMSRAVSNAPAPVIEALLRNGAYSATVNPGSVNLGTLCTTHRESGPARAARGYAEGP